MGFDHDLFLSGFFFFNPNPEEKKHKITSFLPFFWNTDTLVCDKLGKKRPLTIQDLQHPKKLSGLLFGIKHSSSVCYFRR